MLATLSNLHSLPALARPKVSARSDSASKLYPPILEACAAQADPGFCQNPVCLVSNDIFCGYRLTLTSLGNYCLHPWHAKIVERTVEAKALEKPPERF